MPRAKSFEHLGAVAVNVLARSEAKKQVKEQLRGWAVANKTEEQLMLELVALATLFAFAFCATLSVLCVFD